MKTLTLSQRIKLRELNLRALTIRSDANKDDDKWITTESGSHILVDKDGIIQGGAGGKFTGQHLSSMGGTKEFTQYETVKEREKHNKPVSESKQIETTSQPGIGKVLSKNGKALKFIRTSEAQAEIDKQGVDAFVQKKGNSYYIVPKEKAPNQLVEKQKSAAASKKAQETKQKNKAIAQQKVLENEPKRTLWGDTYHIKDELKSRFDAKWDGNRWSVPQSKWEEAKQFMKDNPKPKVAQSSYKPSSQSSTSYIPINDIGQDLPEWVRERDLQ